MDGTVEDMNIWGLAGDKNSHYDEDPLMPNNWPKCTGESEYMLFNMEDAWNGLIDKFAFEFVSPTADTVIYIEEIALFADGDAAYTYAGMERETEAPETQAPETQAPETQAPETQAPATEAPAETDAPAGSGCSSVIGFGTVAVLAAAAAFVALKKKD